MNNKIKWGFNGKEADRQGIIASCGKGWENLIERLISDLFVLGWDGCLFQIKEKFGGLRFYVGTMSKPISKRILQAEDESVETCIVCGKRGKLYYDGWVAPFCEEHAKEKGRTVSDPPIF